MNTLPVTVGQLEIYHPFTCLNLSVQKGSRSKAVRILFEKAKEGLMIGNEEPFNELLQFLENDIKATARKVCYKIGCKSEAYEEELISNGCIAIWELVRDHDLDNVESPIAYIQHSIKNKMICEQRKANSSKQMTLMTEDVTKSNIKTFEEISREDLKELDREGIIDKIFQLGTLEYQVVRLAFGLNKEDKMYNQKEIAALRGKTKGGTVNGKFHSGIAKVRLALEILDRKGHLENTDIAAIRDLDLNIPSPAA
ncbi:MAG: hypothetical protein HYY52_01880 [Candidatus Melainabacteria bacterium]|nr:hypothetical protein [Candidatus Melainabacteria bacterium]